MTFEEQDRVAAQLHGVGWRHLLEPQPVCCYVASAWMELPVGEVNDETREVRATYGTVEHGIRKFILDASHYQLKRDLFQYAHRGADADEPPSAHRLPQRPAEQPSHDDVRTAAGAAAHSDVAASTFRCPRCGGIYSRAMLTRFWSEWGRVCVCAATGAIDDHCSALTDDVKQ